MLELLLWEELVPNKDIYKRATFSNHVLLHSINFFRIDIFSRKVPIQNRYIFRTITFLEKANSSKKHYSEMHTFSGELLFQGDYFFKRPVFPLAVTVSEELLFHKIRIFSENLLFHSYSSFPQLRFLFIS